MTDNLTIVMPWMVALRSINGLEKDARTHLSVRVDRQVSD